MDGSPPGSPISGILQARTLEWVAILSPMHESEKWKWSRVWLLATPWIAAHQAPPSMGFSPQEYWSWVPLPSPMKYIRMGNLHPKSQCLNQFTGISDTIAYSYLPRTFGLPTILSSITTSSHFPQTMYFIASSSLLRMFFIVHSAELILLSTLIITYSGE